MARPPRTGDLGLFRASAPRLQPRDANGRFVAVRYSAQRLRILANARQMAADLGLPVNPYLTPFGQADKESRPS